MSIIPILRRLRHGDHESKASQGHMVTPCLKNLKIKIKARYSASSLY
jgi:hypothetical protein